MNKKIFNLYQGLLTAVLMLFFTTPTWANEVSCANGAGIEIIGKNNSHYCRSQVAVTWYAAFSWCKSQNMHLVTWEELCPTDSREIMLQSTLCSNISPHGREKNDTEQSWINLPEEDNYSYALVRAKNYGFFGKTARHKLYPALCIS